MKQNKINKETEQKKLNDWKSLAESLNFLLHLEASEIKYEFKNQKKNLSVWLESVNDSLHNVKDLSEEKAQKLKSSINLLRVQAALGEAETEEALKEQQQKISDGIQQLQKDITDAYDSSKEKIGDFAWEALDNLDGFHTRFDLFRLQFHLGKEEAKEDWEQKKKDISNKLHTINFKIAKGYEDRAENWDHFSDEIAEAWKHIKNSFKI
jgi:CII-binding regulator of phage lambda lysogenization HflD